MTPIAVIAALIVGGWIAADVRDRRKCRAAELISLSHPARRQDLRKFGDGPMPRHEDAPLTLAEEEAFRLIAAAEHQWISQAIQGRKEGERS